MSKELIERLRDGDDLSSRMEAATALTALTGQLSDARAMLTATAEGLAEATKRNTAQAAEIAAANRNVVRLQEFTGKQVAEIKAPLQAEIERLREALTPSGSTKAAYIGEFKFSIDLYDDEGEEISHEVNVPWTTTKAIMMAIAARATLSGEQI